MDVSSIQNERSAKPVEWLRRFLRREPAPYHRLAGFLPPQVAQRVLEQILAQRQNFCAMTGHRNFMRLPHTLPLDDEFFRSIRAILPELQKRFAIDLERPEIELYVHAFNDGTRFDRHSDSYGGGNWRRRLSCVFYVHCVPRRFEGGSLVIYDKRGRAYAVEPEHNSAVFFPSNLIHEVLPVICESRDFADSRFAINIWIM